MISRKRLLVFIFPIIIGGIILFTVFYIFIKPKIANKSRLQSITESLSNSALCIHTTVVGQETSEVIQPTAIPNPNGGSSTIIKSLIEDTGGCLKFVGDTIHFSMEVSETGGIVTVDIGDVHKGIQLYDDGTHGDKNPGDGIYELDYVTSQEDAARNVLILGKYSSVKDSNPSEIYSQTSITIVNWQSGESSVDSKAEYTKDQVTGDIYVKDRLVIGFEEGTSQESIINSFANNDLQVASWIPELFLFEIELGSDQDYETIKSQLVTLPSVIGVDRNYAVEMLNLPLRINDDRMPIDQSNYLNVIRAKLGWNISQGKSDILVGSPDSGVGVNHPDLLSSIAWYIPCPAACYYDASNISHGTKIAGIIAAEQGRSGISGIAPGVRLIVSQCVWDNKQQTCGGIVELAERIFQITNRGAKVINLSFTQRNNLALWLAITYAYNKNVVLVAGVGQGDQGRQFYKEHQSGDHKVYPASYDEVLAVGATETDDNVSYYSDYGYQVVYAPVPSKSGGILSTDKTGGWSVSAGTSYAVPQVAALAALIISVDPKLTNDQVVDIITRTSDSLQPGNLGIGRINVYRALMVASGKQDPGEYPLPVPIMNLSVVIDEFNPPSVLLRWDIPFGDYTGVHIYRKSISDGSMFQLEGGLIPGTSYKDQNVSYGETYQYYVFSVDSRGQESVEYLKTSEIELKQQAGVTGNWIAYVGPDENVWLIHPDGTGSTQLTYDGKPGQGFWDPVVGYRNLKWSPDGSMLGMLRVDKAGSQIQAIQMLDKKVVSLISNTEGSFDWLPDSHSIIISNIPYEDANVRGDLPGGLSILDISTGTITPFIDAGSEMRLTNPHWSPQGGNVFFRIDVAPRPIGIWPSELGFTNSSGGTFIQVPNSDDCSWSPDGEKLVCNNLFGEQLSSDLIIFSNYGSKLSEISIAACCTFNHNPAWSPDGNWITFQSPGYDIRWGSIYIVKPDGGGLTNLVRDLAGAASPEWSPDGKSIAILSGEKGSVNISIINSDGTDLKSVTNVSGDIRLFAWQPNIVSRPVHICDIQNTSRLDKSDDLSVINYVNQAVLCKNAEAIAPLISKEGATLSAGYATDFFSYNTEEEVISELTTAFSISSPTCTGYYYTTRQHDKIHIYFENININWTKYNSDLLPEKHVGFLFSKYQGIWELFGIVPVPDWGMPSADQLLACPISSIGGTPKTEIPTPGSKTGLIAYISDYNVWVMHPDGSEPRQITFDGLWGPSKYRVWPVISYGGLRWSPNGDYLAVNRVTQRDESSILLIRMSDFNITELVSNVQGSFDWSSDSQSIVFSETTYKSILSGGLSIINIETRGLTNYLDAGPNEQYLQPDWSNDGKYIFFNIRELEQSEDNIYKPILGLAKYPEGTYIEIQNPIGCDWHPGSDKFICMVEHRGQQCNIFTIYSITGSKLESIPEIGESCSIMNQMKWSPDGTTIAFIGYFSDSSLGDLYVMNSDGSELKNLTNDLIMEGSPFWSPDGNYIYFNATEDGKTNIYRMDMNGNNMIRVTNTGNDFGAAWQPQP